MAAPFCLADHAFCKQAFPIVTLDLFGVHALRTEGIMPA
jgi:hypothetical protein